VISFHEVAVGLFLKRKSKLLAVLIGIALAGVPMGAFTLWVNWFIGQQGREEVEEVARRSLALADRRAARVIHALADLARRGIDGCSPDQIEALRRTNFATTPIKEISVIDPNGNTICTDLGVPLGLRQVVSSHPLTADGRILVEVMRLGDSRESMVRVRRTGGGDANALAALMPTELFLPLTAGTADGSGVKALAITTRDGALLSEGGDTQQDGPNDKDRFAATAKSDRYNLVATVSLSREQVAEAYAHLHTIGTVASGLLALGIIAFALILPTRRRNDPVAELERALQAGEFVPYFHPVVDITTGRLRGAEVLIRWRKPDGSVALPGTFVHLLESSGLILDVTCALMRRVRDEVGAAYGPRPKLKVGFNLAASHFADETIVRDIRDVFEDSPIRFNQIILEVTERQPLDNLTETRRVIAALQGLGVGISIDDVGTGHSGLSYMLKLGVDVIKIDKMFIDAIGADRNSATIIETLIELARNLRMDIIAEGVETFEQIIFLREIGVRAAQGYVFAPPLPASSYLQLIEAIDPLPKVSLNSASGRAAIEGARAPAAA
jgi:sensor c-di-GMP phosphodiesterase-like protein